MALKKDSILYQISEGIHDLCYISAKEFHNTFTDEGMVIFFLLVPLLYPVLYCWIYSKQMVKDVPVAVVDNSHSKLSREFIRHLDATEDIDVAYFCNSLDEGKELVGRQQVRGVVYFPSDFEKKLDRQQQTNVSAYVDMSVMLNYKQILTGLTAVSQDLNSKIQIKSSGSYTTRDEEITTRPLDFTDVPIFSPVLGYGDCIIPPVMMLILYQTLLLGIGLSAGTARENNRYGDLVPIAQHYNGIFRIVFGKGFCYFTIYLAMSGISMLIIPKLFGYIQLVTFQRFLGLIVPFLLASIFFGMTLSCLVRYRENVIMLVVFSSVPLLFMANISWPISGMPGYWQSIACIFPSTFGMRAWMRLNTMGATVQDVAPEYNALWIQTVLYFFTTCWVYHYQIKTAKSRALNSLNTLYDKAESLKNKKLQAQQQS
jgi:ABC-2 type transport system permease protein